jgi:hypothetical protein
MGDSGDARDATPSKVAGWPSLVQSKASSGDQAGKEAPEAEASRLTRQDLLVAALPSLTVVLAAVFVPVVYSRWSVTQFFVVTGGMPGAVDRWLPPGEASQEVRNINDPEYQMTPLLGAVIALVIVTVNHLASFRFLKPLQLQVYVSNRSVS